MHKKHGTLPVRATWTRRNFIKAIAIGGIAIMAGLAFLRRIKKKEPRVETFIASQTDYGTDIRQPILYGFKELGITSAEINGKRVLLKPNLVEPHLGISHINTHPSVIRAAVEAFLYLGAAKVLVAEGAGHQRDSLRVLEESGLADVLYEDRIPFIDLNTDSVLTVKNSCGLSKLEHLILPREIVRADYIVSVAKMKTHHWVGVTLSMKNLFGVMPGIIYGWPKNVLHWAGIHESILDITAVVKPHLAIVDGIVGMEGDGPIMGIPVQANVIVIGKNLPAVDATSARIMGIDPIKIPYLRRASGLLGTISESSVIQRGESIASMRQNFQLLDDIPAHKGLRLR
jgi:uncharacterized protein (DUF362 family)